MAGNRVFVAIGEHRKAFTDELIGGMNELLDIGVKELAVADQFELHPIRFESFACQLGGQNGVPCGDASGGVRQQPVSAAENVHQALGIALQADPADRGGDQFRAARFEAIEHHLLVRITSRADDQPGGERGAGNGKRVGHRNCPA